MKHIKKNLLWVILTAVMAVLLVVVIVGNAIMLNYESLVNMALGISPTRIVKAKGDEDLNRTYFPSDYDSAEDLLEEDRYWAEILTEEGAVLLKNENNSLPVSNTAKVSIFGHSSVNAIVCGTGSADIDATGAPTLKESLEARGVSVNPSLWNFYVDNIDVYPTNPEKGDAGIRKGSGSVKGYYTVNEIPLSAYTSAAKSEYSTYNDAAIVVIARLGGEMYDIPASVANGGNPNETVNGSGNMLELTIQERALLEHVSASFDNVIVLVNTANAIEFDFIDVATYGVDSCMWIGYTGLMGMEGVADLLVGNSNPSGRLVDTFCVDNTTSPAMANFYGGEWANGRDMEYVQTITGNGGGELDSNRFYNVYQEGIYVGYRYYETRYEDYVLGQGNAGEYNYDADVKYPFGYGLSYTSFEYSGFNVVENETSFDVTVTVTNTGSVAGKEVVEVYFQSPYTDYDKENGIEKSAIELCGFAKVPQNEEDLTALLQPGDSETVTINVDKKELRTYDANNAKTYILEDGDYYISIGTDAHNALNNVLVKKGADEAKMSGVGNGEFAYKWTNDTFDATTYAISNDGVENYPITNLFDNGDLNKLTAEQNGGQFITYLSRNNWTETFPTTAIQLNLTDYLHDNLTGIKKYRPSEYADEAANLSLPTMGKEGDLTLAQMIGKDFDDPMWQDLLDQVTFEEMCQLIGVGYHSTTVMYSIAKPQTIDENGPQGFTKKLTDVTGEGGKSCAYTDENIMAATWNVLLMEQIGKQLGEDIMWAGGSGLYGPAMNTHRTPFSGRNFEYYSEDGFLAGKIAAAECAGIQSKGCYVYIKHFALNDSETNCRCSSIFANEQAIRELYLQPFEHAIVEGGAKNVMNSFSRIGVVWTGAHKGLMTDLLRNEWGMEGFAITDYSTSGSTYQVRLGLIAGTDTWDCSGYDAWGKELELTASTDPVMLNAMRNATHRILYTVANSNAMNGIGPNDYLEPSVPWWKATVFGVIIGLAILTAASGAILTVKIIKGVKQNKN